MAVSTLFLADMTLLRAQLRLTGVPTSSDANDILDAAVLVARTGFYRELGSARVAVLVAMSSVDAPDSDNEILRKIAEQTEFQWVRMELMRTLPMLFMDGSGNRDQIWNDEGAFRQASTRHLETERKRIQAEIKQNLVMLKATETIGTEKTVGSWSIAPELPQRPGGTFTTDIED